MKSYLLRRKLYDTTNVGVATCEPENMHPPAHEPDTGLGQNSLSSICRCHTAPLSIDSHVVCEAAYASLHSLTIVPLYEGAPWKFAFCFTFPLIAGIEAEEGLWDDFAVVLSAEGTLRLEDVDVEVIVVVLQDNVIQYQ